ncbi:MAG: DNA-binding protein [Deltaproteobacteria bacterium HGW-Deltaproteobacteria-14]|jgi:transcriptional regulator with XRE-family HTH domain|nr:MAG: DNA-binding protein [Deltaproteobacteria bacterium HGW-Deltaproteobacteria-14]
MTEDLGDRIAKNVRQLRLARGLTQAQMAKVGDLPRATWTNLESGSANPTISVLHRAAMALQVAVEELLSAPRGACELFPLGTLPERIRGQARVRKLLPHPIPGMEMDRIELPPDGRMGGIPHTPGTREYLTCELGELDLVVAGDTWHLRPGDVISFRADQKHSYANPGGETAVGYSVVVLVPDP